jgi:hypothetical protein
MENEYNMEELENDNEEVRQILQNYIDKSTRFRYKLIKFFYYYKRNIFFLLFLGIIILILFLFVSFSGFTFSRITDYFSIAALILTLTSIMYRGIMFKEYPVEDLTIKRLKEDLYEINFLIKNAGYGKLKLDFAFYAVENKAFSNIDDFFTCSSMVMGEYFGNLLRKLDNSKNDEMELFSLKSLQKENDVFFTHEESNIQTRLRKFKENRLYKITFFFQTSKKINYEISKHIIT